VRAILGVLDAMQQKLGAGAEKAYRPLGVDGWRSMISVDIRILVGVGTAGAEGAEKDELELEGTGRTFMYVLI